MSSFEVNFDHSLHAARGYSGQTPQPPRSHAALLTKLGEEYGSVDGWLGVAKSTALLAPVIAIGAGGMLLGSRLFGVIAMRRPAATLRWQRLLNLENFRLTFDELASAPATGILRCWNGDETYLDASASDFAEGMVARSVLNRLSLKTTRKLTANSPARHRHFSRFVLLPAFLTIGSWVAEAVVEEDKKFSDAISGGIGWDLAHRWIGAFSMMHVQSNLLRFPKLFGLSGSFHADDWVSKPINDFPLHDTLPPPPLPSVVMDRIRGVGPLSAARSASQTIRSISDIHGGHYTTPHAGRKIQNLQGVVTAVGRGGFWVQEPSSSGNDAFRGIYVRMESPNMKAGDLVNLSGEVSVFRPAARELSQIQIDRTRCSVVGTGELPPPVLIGEGGRMPPESIFKGAATKGDLEDLKTEFRPDRDAIAFYKGLEDTRVRLANPLVVGVSTRGTYAVALDGGKHLRHKTPEGLPILMPGGPNTDVLTIDFGLLPKKHKTLLQAGDLIDGDLVGILDYSFGQFRLRVTEPFKVKRQPIERPTTTTLVGDDEHFTVAHMNVENLSPTDTKRIRELAKIITSNLRSPDVIALQEGMDNSGAKDDGTTKASHQLLIEEIKRIGKAKYQYIDVAPKDKEDGGKPGGNIRVAYLVRTDRITMKLHDGGDYDDPARLELQDGQLHLRQNPARVDPGNPAYEHSRKPLALEYSFNGRTFIHVNLHSTSRRGDDPLWGRYQPPAENSGATRLAQHAPVIAFWEGAQRLHPDAAFIVGGDLNAYAWEQSVQAFVRAGLVDLAETKLPRGANYTYYYDGAVHYHSFDHLLTSANLAQDAQIEILHLNSGRKEQFSDHDVKVVRLRVPKRP